MENSHLHQPHDKLFKASFRDIPTAVAFFQNYLSTQTLRRLDFSRLTLCPGSHVTRRLKTSESDLLFRVGLKGSHEDAFLYLLVEHQYEEDRWIGLRLSRYRSDIWENFCKKKPGATHLSLSIPVVLAHNKAAWNLSPRFDERLFSLPADAKTDLSRYIPAFDFELVQLSEIPFEKIVGTPLGIMTMRVFKAQRMGGGFPASHWVWDESLLSQLDIMSLEQFFSYITGRPEFDIVDIDAKLSEFESETIKQTTMTIAQRYIQRGIEEGRQEGIQTGRQEGILIGRIQLLEEMLHREITPGELLSMQTLDQLEALCKRLKRELS